MNSRSIDILLFYVMLGSTFMFASSIQEIYFNFQDMDSDDDDRRRDKFARERDRRDDDR